MHNVVGLGEEADEGVEYLCIPRPGAGDDDGGGFGDFLAVLVVADAGAVSGGDEAGFCRGEEGGVVGVLGSFSLADESVAAAGAGDSAAVVSGGEGCGVGGGLVPFPGGVLWM